jgi:hypothetical protein
VVTLIVLQNIVDIIWKVVIVKVYQLNILIFIGVFRFFLFTF